MQEIQLIVIGNARAIFEKELEIRLGKASQVFCVSVSKAIDRREAEGILNEAFANGFWLRDLVKELDVYPPIPEKELPLPMVTIKDNTADGDIMSVQSLIEREWSTQRKPGMSCQKFLDKCLWIPWLIPTCVPSTGIENNADFRLFAMIMGMRIERLTSLDLLSLALRKRDAILRYHHDFSQAEINLLSLTKDSLDDLQTLHRQRTVFAQTRALMLKAIDKHLTELEKKCLVHCISYGTGCEALAAELGEKPEKTRQRIHRALLKLRTPEVLQEFCLWPLAEQ